MSNHSQGILNIFLPEGITEYFTVTHWSKDETDVRIIFEEIDDPPSETSQGKKVVSKGFHDITITDFPIRGRRALLTFRRRYWQIEGQKELLKRDIRLCFPGTQLQHEFALFLKEECGRDPDVALIYRNVSKDQPEKI